MPMATHFQRRPYTHLSPSTATINSLYGRHFLEFFADSLCLNIFLSCYVRVADEGTEAQSSQGGQQSGT